jgi:hypothetical protein
VTAILAGPARHARMKLRGGAVLLEAVTEAMAVLGWSSATLLLLGGPMARAVYHTSILTPGGPRWIDYGPAKDVPAPAWLVMGSATFGTALDGGPALHCHAVLSGGGRVVGGHLSPQACVLGADGLIAHATGAENAGFHVVREPSGFDLLTPAT